jgi:hypothetical protein
MKKLGIFNIYFYPLSITSFGIRTDYKLLEISLIWYNLIIDWAQEDENELL